MSEAVRNAKTWQEAQEKAPPGASLAGWVTVDEREMLFQLAKAMKPGEVMVEIGVYGGANLSLFALASPPGTRIIGIDDFSNMTHFQNNQEHLDAFCYRTVALCGPDAAKIEIVARSSHDVGPTWSTPINILRVDGDHTLNGARMDLDQFAEWVVIGGVILMDNYADMLEVRQAFDEWLKEEPAGCWSIEHRYEDHVEGNILTVRRAK